ncbi:MAG: hypothetical protein NTW86_28350 [Candidatus Sumerlaeota bacterium]|nr:hypothetical protein [Candidatus Sumerlaeota bacterium]
MRRTATWAIASISLALALSTISRAETVQGPNGAFEATLPGEWTKGQTSGGLTAWSPKAPELSAKMLVTVGGVQGQKELAPAEQLTQSLSKASEDFPRAAGFTRKPFNAAGVENELVQFSFGHGKAVWRAYALAFPSGGALSFIAVSVPELSPPDLSGAALAILKSVSPKAPGATPAEEKGKSRGLDDLFEKSGKPQPEKPLSWDPPIAGMATKPGASGDSSGAKNRPAAEGKPLAALFSAQNANQDLADKISAAPHAPAPSAAAPAASPGAAATPAPGRESLNDPVPPEIQQLVRAGIQSWLNAPVVAPHVDAPGWPLFVGGDWSFQYPPGWQIRRSSPYDLWVADPRGLDHFIFVQIQQVNSMAPIEQIGAALFASFAQNAPARILDTARKNTWPPNTFPDDTGLMQVWYVRWLHPQVGKMFATYSVTILARAVTGVTSLQWILMNCPEAEAVQASQAIFSPLMLSGRFTIPAGGGDTHPTDSDNDGYPDDVDQAPNDPNVH